MSEEAEFSKIVYVRNIRGCYLLWKNGTVVYVGQSINIMARVGIHLANNKKDFDGYSFVEYSGNLNELESDLIIRYKPQLNENLPNNSRFASDEIIKNKLKINRWELKKLIHKLGATPIWKNYYRISDFLEAS